MIEADVVDCMISLPGQLFYSTQIPACLWFLSRNKANHGFRDRRGEVLFIDARKLGHLVDRTRLELSEDDVAKVARTYHAWRGEKAAGEYKDEPGFCKVANLEAMKTHSWVLTPGRYVGASQDQEDTIPFKERFSELHTRLKAQAVNAQKLDTEITDVLAKIIFHG
jgi:type I restriction enzyme M protein